MIGFRPSGHDDILNPTENQNYNYELAKENYQNKKTKMFICLFFISLLPIAHMIHNAEDNFKKAQIKKITSKRRARLDKEHGIDRDQMTEDYQKLDERFRITEKEEIKKYLQIGKTAEQYYED